MIEASIREFNQLSKQHKLGVTLEASDTAPVPGPGHGRGPVSREPDR